MIDMFLIESSDRSGIFVELRIFEDIELRSSEMLTGRAGMPDLRSFSIPPVERLLVHKWISESQEIASST